MTPFATRSKTYQSGHQICLEACYNPYVADKFRKLFHIQTRHYCSTEKNDNRKAYYSILPKPTSNVYYSCTPILCSFSPLKRFHFYMVGQGEQLYRVEVIPVNTVGCLVQSATILITPFNHPRRQTYPYKNDLHLMVCYFQFSFTSFRLPRCNIAPHEYNET